VLTKAAASKPTTKLIFLLQHKVLISDYRESEKLNATAWVLITRRFQRIQVSDCGDAVTKALLKHVDHSKIFVDGNHTRRAYYMPEMQVLLNFLFSDRCQHSED
jgi:hypothetical protein